MAKNQVEKAGSHIDAPERTKLSGVSRSAMTVNATLHAKSISSFLYPSILLIIVIFIH